MAEKLIVGWNERVELPEWGIRSLRAKIDTGARSSALHVAEIEPLPRDRVGFDVVLSRKRLRRVHVIASISRVSRVRSSTGHRQVRYFTRVVVKIGPILRQVEVSLVNREQMLFRMLLGRTALAGIMVDPMHAGLLRPPGQRRPAARRSS